MTKIFPLNNRELSWLSFNHRVLEEAKDENVPLYERIKFLSIFSSNLDEFFRVRVASLLNLAQVKPGKLPAEIDYNPSAVLSQVYAMTMRHQEEFGQILRYRIIPSLRENNIILYQDTIIKEVHEQEITKLFKNKILAYLQPVFIRPDDAVSHFLAGNALYFALKLRSKKNNGDEFQYAYVNIPSDKLPRYMLLSPADGQHYIIPLDEIIRKNLTVLFPSYEVLTCHSVKLNRNEDVEIADEYSGDLVKKIRQQIEKRKTGTPTRFLYDFEMNEADLAVFAKAFGVNKNACMPGGRHHNLQDLAKLPNPVKPHLENTAQPGLSVAGLEATTSLFEAISQKDYMLHYPYHSYEYVLRFFNEAAVDEFVTEIKVTLYRITANSPIANALISAAKNGKEVTVFVEVKARYDEGNNLKWAEEMEKAGINIIYSMPGLKVHAKAALIKKVLPDGIKERYAYLSTGNFNENTAQVYADDGLFTSHKGITKELDMLFKFLKTKREEGMFSRLLVSQFNMKKKILFMIDNEIFNARVGKPARIIFKMNGIDEPKIIRALYEASMEGVKVDLIVRGICTPIPGLKGLSENMRIIRLVDRYLEHSRAMIFHNGGDELMYLSSADMMDRNLNRRIELGFPVYDAAIKAEMKQIIEMQLSDTEKAKMLDADLKHQNIIPVDKKVRAQAETYYMLKERQAA